MAKHKRYQPASIRKGFTLIEVALVMAISAALFVGVMGGITVNITRQRYNDSVQNFAEFLRRQYSEVVSVQNPRSEDIDRDAPCTTTSPYRNIYSSSVTAQDQTGRSDCLIYGKLITFGETDNYDTGLTLEEELDVNRPHTVYSYDIIGDNISPDVLADSDNPDYGLMYTSDDVPSEILRALANVHAGVSTLRRQGTDTCALVPAGNETEYNYEWNAYATPVYSDFPIEGSLLIVRHPLSNSIQTIFIAKAVPVQALNYSYNDVISVPYSECYQTDGIGKDDMYEYSLENFLVHPFSYYVDDSGVIYRTSTVSTANLSTSHVVEFCISSDDFLALEGGRRRMISIDNFANNSSAVQIIAQDSEENKCQ